MKFFLASTGLLALLAPLSGAQGAVISAPQLNETLADYGNGNVLLLVADDIGVDMIRAYHEGNDLPPTPTLDWLATRGILFRNAYSNPAGSVTMGTVETGRYAQRTGIGYVVYTGDMPLQPEEIIIAEMLDMGAPRPYSHAMIGKWFLGNSNVPPTYNPYSALLAGYGYFEGLVGQLYLGGFDYFTHELNTNGIIAPSNTYATTEQVNSALSWIATAPEPWFCHVAFSCAHTPIHYPPSNLFTISIPTTLPPHGDGRPWYKAMIEALDTELGRLFASMDPQVLERTTIIFVTDNGTPDGLVVPPFINGHGKLTGYEGGINVPMIISGPLVKEPRREESALVHTVDIFATIADIAQVDLATTLPPGYQIDSVSMYPYLVHPHVRDQRETVYSEMFYPNGFSGPYISQKYAIRNERWKLLLAAEGTNPLKHHFFDLLNDPFESTNLLGHGLTLSPAETLIYQDLLAEMNAILALP